MKQAAPTFAPGHSVGHQGFALKESAEDSISPAREQAPDI